MLKIGSEELRDDVIAELDADPKVDAARVGVAVEDGVVTLTGTVPNFAHKWAAEEAAKRVKGVVAVVHQIEVDLSATHQRNDTDIAHAVADGFYWDTSIPDTVQADVQRGYVTLSGEVDWNYQREEAEAIARRIAGVCGISNFITLKKAVPEQDIRGEIQRRFHRDAQIDANNTRIAAEGGKVRLTGTVHSWFERNEASRAAWSVKGVTAVDNRLAVVF
jgi:osmotically-inducible protein OsmY